MNALKIQFPKTIFIPNIAWNNAAEKSNQSQNNLTVPTPMEHDEVLPPAHVWDKIAQVLDEQDALKKENRNKKLKQNFYNLSKIAIGFLILISTLYLIFN